MKDIKTVGTLAVIFFLAAAVALITTLGGCRGSGNNSQNSREVRSSLQRNTSPTVPDGDLEAQVAGNNAFAFDLYGVMRDLYDDNLFYSPYSISLALAMTSAGARNNTEVQIADTFHFLPQVRLHPAFNALDLELSQRGQSGDDDKRFKLHVVNALWGQEDFPFLDSFLDTLALHYDAGLRVLDFVSDPEDARVAINKWVKNQTEDRIVDLIPKGIITELTRLVLTNAIYFKAAWDNPFDEDLTADAPFYLTNGDTVQVPMMLTDDKSSFAGARGDNYWAVDLPYYGNELSMLIIMPDEGQFAQLEQSMGPPLLDEIEDKMMHGHLNFTEVSMPKFQVNSSYDLNQLLKELGMTDAFEAGQANFTGIAGPNYEMFIQSILHKGFIDVNEAGTEAAAATAVVIGVTSIAPGGRIELDHPFIYMIRDHKTNTIFFMGRVLNPG